MSSIKTSQHAREDESFAQQTARLRAELYTKTKLYQFWNDCMNMLYPDDGLEVWYGDGGQPNCYVHLIWKPGTLSSRILQYEADLPRYGTDLIIDGDDIRHCDHKPWVDIEEEDDTEDVSEELMLLVLLNADDDKHFVKKASYKSEIRNLLLTHASPFTVTLLGRTPDGDLVFPKYPSDLFWKVTRTSSRTIANFRKWLLEIIEGVEYLHSVGIVHRDLVIRNLLVGDRIVIADLQCKYGSLFCLAPEVRKQTNFSPASDVYALGMCIWQMCYFNTPPPCIPFLDLIVPSPFNEIVKACMQEAPEARPSLRELRDMLEALPIIA